MSPETIDNLKELVMTLSADRQKAIIRTGNVYYIVDYADILLSSIVRLYASLGDEIKPTKDEPLTEQALTVIRGKGL